MEGRYRGAGRAFLLSECQRDLLHSQVNAEETDRVRTDNRKKQTENQLVYQSKAWVKLCLCLCGKPLLLTKKQPKNKCMYMMISSTAGIDLVLGMYKILPMSKRLCLCVVVSVWVCGGIYPPTGSDGLVRSSMMSPSTWTVARSWAYWEIQVHTQLSPESNLFEFKNK